MKSITIRCDRCKLIVEGFLSLDGNTSRFYRVNADILAGTASWNDYGRDGEALICDACMHADPKYLKDFFKP